MMVPYTVIRELTCIPDGHRVGQLEQNVAGWKEIITRLVCFWVHTSYSAPTSYWICILLMDGHHFRLLLALIKMAKENGVHLFCVPPYTTHIAASGCGGVWPL